MDEKPVLHRISELVEEEHRLRAQAQAGSLSTDEERDRLRHVEEALDQCWDLLRQRRAARAAGADEGNAQVRDVAQVDICMDRARELTLLFDPEHALDDRITMEQFAA